MASVDDGLSKIFKLEPEAQIAELVKEAARARNRDIQIVRLCMLLLKAQNSGLKASTYEKFDEILTAMMESMSGVQGDE